MNIFYCTGTKQSARVETVASHMAQNAHSKETRKKSLPPPTRHGNAPVSTQVPFQLRGLCFVQSFQLISCPISWLISFHTVQVMPGLLLCFVLRFDAHKKLQMKNSDAGIPGPVGSLEKIRYFHCALIGYFLGNVTPLKKIIPPHSTVTITKDLLPSTKPTRENARTFHPLVSNTAFLFFPLSCGWEKKQVYSPPPCRRNFSKPPSRRCCTWCPSRSCHCSSWPT